MKNQKPCEFCGRVTDHGDAIIAAMSAEGWLVEYDSRTHPDPATCLQAGVPFCGKSVRMLFHPSLPPDQPIPSQWLQLGVTPYHE